MSDQVMGRISGRFGRVEPRATDRTYLRGLLSSVERKNGWQLAEQAGRTRPGPIQRLLRCACWYADAVRDGLRAYAVEYLGADGVPVLDETGFLKKGRASAGVQKQYTRAAGCIENAQVGVFLDLTTERGRVLINRRLHLPEHPGPTTPNAAGIPETVQFLTEPCLAQEMIAAAPEADITASCVVGDEALPTACTRALSLLRLDMLGSGDRSGPASATPIGIGRPARDAAHETAQSS
ncbi:transposase [Streptomyces rubiginosohelvolus]|uniref:IS701 family transposase n=1 Tax=Streptomyces rubiginosohelvolus TaxID=67362 RepID=UPI003700685A